MPRLTAKDYLRTHDRLHRLWLRDPALFAELGPADQWLLHDFFVPDRELSDLELLAYRDTVTAQRPSLPYQAGRGLSRFWETTAHVGMKRVAKAKALAVTQSKRQADRNFAVKPLTQSEIDAEKLARAYIHLARDLAKKRAEQDDQERSRP